MQNITIGRFDKDPQAQGCIRPENGSWQLVLDKDGFPHLWIQVTLEEDGKPIKGMLCLEDLLPPEQSVQTLMGGGGVFEVPTQEEQDKAYAEYCNTEREIPCPR